MMRIVLEGVMTEFYCVSQFKTKWFLNEVEVQGNERININGSTMQIVSVKKHDQGNVTCHIFNGNSLLFIAEAKLFVKRKFKCKHNYK